MNKTSASKSLGFPTVKFPPLLALTLNKKDLVLDEGATVLKQGLDYDANYETGMVRVLSDLGMRLVTKAPVTGRRKTKRK